jgi:hypothetical protein
LIEFNYKNIKRGSISNLFIRELCLLRPRIIPATMPIDEASFAPSSFAAFKRVALYIMQEEVDEVNY